MSNTAVRNMAYCARLTAPGRGAIAVIGWKSASHCPEMLDQLPFRSSRNFQLSSVPLNRIIYGDWSGEDVVIIRTSNNDWEVNCHGGDLAVARIVADLERLGFRQQSATDWLTAQRTFLEAETWQAASCAMTARTAERLVFQATTGWSKLCDWPEDLLSVVDYIDRLLACWPFGRRLVEGWKIVMAGKPNVGKSSLLNSVLGIERAIVFDQPGTTRDFVTGNIAIDGWPTHWIDTAGLHETACDIEATGISKAREKLAEADLRLVVIDSNLPPSDEDKRVLDDWPDAIVVANKSDLATNPHWRDTLASRITINVSTRTADGIDQLRAQVIQQLVPAAPAIIDPLPLTDRQHKILQMARDAAARNDGRLVNQLHYQLIHGEGLANSTVDDSTLPVIQQLPGRSLDTE